MRGEPVVRGRRTNTVTLVFPVIGSVETLCTTCARLTNHGIIGDLTVQLVMCGVCNEVRTR